MGHPQLFHTTSTSSAIRKAILILACLCKSAFAQPVPDSDQELKTATAPVWQAWGDLVANLDRALERNNVPAAALVIVDANQSPGAQVKIKTFGSATPQTPFRLGSITKTFTSLALLHAAAASNTPLSTPAREILVEPSAATTYEGAETLSAPQQVPAYWSNSWHKTHPVTLGQLVELSAGFGDISRAEFDSAVPIDRKEALAIHKPGHTTHWPPGTLHSYSNLPPAFSALAVEQMTGESFENYLHTHVLLPLGLSTATLKPDRKLPGGYKADGLTEIPYWHTIYPAFGGLNARPNEFARFLLKLTTDRLPPGLAAAKRHRGAMPLYQPTTTGASRVGLEIGYGAGIYGWERHGFLFAGHGGDADGYRSRFAIVPEAKRAYFLVINTDNAGLLRRLVRRTEQFLLADLEAPQNKPGPKHDWQATPRNYNRFEDRFKGSYRRASVRFGVSRLNSCTAATADLNLAKTHLLWKRGTSQQVLKAEGPGIYRLEGKRLASVALVDEGGKRTVQGDLGNWLHIDDHPTCAN